MAWVERSGWARPGQVIQWLIWPIIKDINRVAFPRFNEQLFDEHPIRVIM